jgi:ribokinase
MNVDFVYEVDHIVRPGETINARGRNVYPGGKGLNQSVAVARAGGEVYHIGVLGADGEVLEQALKYNLVLGVRYIAITNGERTFGFRSTGDPQVPFEQITSFPDWETMQV